MTPAEIANALRTEARHSDDAALGCEAEAAAHRPEYEACMVPPPGAANHARALELYPAVIQRSLEAAALRAEATLFRAAAEIIEEKLL